MNLERQRQLQLLNQRVTFPDSFASRIKMYLQFCQLDIPGPDCVELYPAWQAKKQLHLAGLKARSVAVRVSGTCWRDPCCKLQCLWQQHECLYWIVLW